MSATALFDYDPDNTLGAAFIGFTLSCMVFGVLTTQVYTYFRLFPQDRVIHKFLVIFVWVLEATDQAFIAFTLYYYTITNSSSPIVLFVETTSWTLVMQLALGACVGAIVKSTYTFRVWSFSGRNTPVTIVLTTLILAQLGFAFAYTARAFHFDRLLYVDRIKTLATIALSLGVVTDVGIAGALCYFLHKLRTGWSKSDTLINTLSLYAINTGVLTSVVSLGTLITLNLMPDNFIFMSIYFVLSKLYAISLMTTLNTRTSVRGKGTDEENHGPNAYSLNPTSGFNRTGAGNHHLHQLQSSASNFKPTKSQLEISVVQEVCLKSDNSPISLHRSESQSNYSPPTAW